MVQTMVDRHVRHIQYGALTRDRRHAGTPQVNVHLHSLFVVVWCCLPMKISIVLHQHLQLSLIVFTCALVVAKMRVSMSRHRASCCHSRSPSDTFDFAFPSPFP